MQHEGATIPRPQARVAQARAAAPGVAITATGLSLKNPRITAYQGVSLDLAAGEVHAILAESHSGKTELLLTLAGRMKASSGELTVDGIDGRTLRGLAQIRKFSGLGWFENVNELEDVVKVHTCVSAELGLAGKKSGRDATAAYLNEWGLADVADVRLGDLSQVDYDRLGIALGMAADPRLLAIDDIERDLTEHQSVKLVRLLKRIAQERHTTVVCGFCDYDIAKHCDSVSCISEDAVAQRNAVEGRDLGQQVDGQIGSDQRTRVLPNTSSLREVA